MEWQHGKREQAGQDHDEWDCHFKCGADDGRHAGGAQVVRSEHALYDEKIRGPVAEGDDKSQAEDDAGPVNAHGVSAEVTETAPQVHVVGAAEVGCDLM